MTDNVVLMKRFPAHLPTVDAVLDTAKLMKLPNVLVVAENGDGSFVFLHTDDLDLATCNWLLDRIKHLMLAPTEYERGEPNLAG